MWDQVEKLGNSIIHHGKYSNRIYLMHYDEKDEERMINCVDLLARNRGYSKIITKLPKSAVWMFLQNGFKEEGRIPGYYQGEETCYFLSKYLDTDRLIIQDQLMIDDVLKAAQNKKIQIISLLSKEFTIRVMNQEDAPNMAKVYQKVFETYPFPIFDSNYIQETMNTHVKYFGVEYRGELIGLSSCEINKKELNVEMTDFAILPKARGHKLAKHLLYNMEEVMYRDQMKTFYTIARASSYAMNAVFRSMGYLYGGTLYNNTQIAGGIESMNIWYKRNMS